MGDVVGPRGCREEGETGLRATKGRMEASTGSEQKQETKGSSQLKTQTTPPLPASLSTAPTAIILFSKQQCPRLQGWEGYESTRLLPPAMCSLLPQPWNKLPPPPAGKGWGCLRCQPGLSSILILPELLHVGLSEKAGRCGADASEAESWASDASFPFHCAALSVSSRLLIASRCSSRNTGLRALSSRILTFHLIASNSLR